MAQRRGPALPPNRFPKPQPRNPRVPQIPRPPDPQRRIPTPVPKRQIPPRRP